MLRRRRRGRRARASRRRRGRRGRALRATSARRSPMRSASDAAHAGAREQRAGSISMTTRSSSPATSSPSAMRCARPRTTLVLPTPAGPTRHGLFAWRFASTSSVRSISSSRPTTGSSSPCAAASVRFRPSCDSSGNRFGSSANRFAAAGVAFGCFFFASCFCGSGIGGGSIVVDVTFGAVWMRVSLFGMCDCWLRHHRGRLMYFLGARRGRDSSRELDRRHAKAHDVRSALLERARGRARLVLTERIEQVQRARLARAGARRKLARPLDGSRHRVVRVVRQDAGGFQEHVHVEAPLTQQIRGRARALGDGGEQVARSGLLLAPSRELLSEATKRDELALASSGHTRCVARTAAPGQKSCASPCYRKARPRPCSSCRRARTCGRRCASPAACPCGRRCSGWSRREGLSRSCPRS